MRVPIPLLDLLLRACASGLALALLAAPAATASAELVVSTGREGGSYHAIGKRLNSAMLLANEPAIRVEPSPGSLENLKRLEDPQSRVNLALTQTDALTGYLEDHPDFADRLFVLGDLGRECAFLVTGADGFEDVGALKAEGFGRVAVDAASSGPAVTLASWARLDPGFGNATPAYEDPLESLIQLEAGGGFTQVRAVLLVQRPNRLSPPVDKVLRDRDRYRLASIRPGQLPNPQLPDGSDVYSFERVSLGGEKYHRRMEVETVCLRALLIGSKAKIDKETRRRLSEVMIDARRHIVGTDQ